MANVSIKFNGKEFLLSCDDGQEDHLEELSNHLNEKFEGLKNTFPDFKGGRYDTALLEIRSRYKTQLK